MFKYQSISPILYLPFRYGRRLLGTFLRMPQRLHAAALARQMSKQEPNLGTVVIVAGRASHSRCHKLACGLRLCNYRVVLLYSNQDIFRFDERIKSLYNEILTYNSPDEALIKAIRFKPIVYHIICNLDYEVAKFFVQNKPGVVIVDTFDVLGGFARPHILRRYFLQEKNERFCFENADGICCRDLRTQYLKKELGYCLSPRLFWSDYCWPVGFTKNQSKLSDGKHVVYAGNIDTDPASPEAFQYDLAQLLAQAKINFHIYPAIQFYVSKLKDKMRNFVPLELMKYVHIHDTLPLLELLSELSAFHVGILISSKDVSYQDDHNSCFAFIKNYFLPAKLFDYHEAGLLCLRVKMRLADHMFPKKWEVRQVQSLQEIVEIVSNMEIRQIKVNPELRLDYHAHRLSEFYQRLYNRG